MASATRLGSSDTGVAFEESIATFSLLQQILVTDAVIPLLNHWNRLAVLMAVWF